MATTTATPPKQDIDLDALEADCQGKLEQLREQESRLSLDALRDDAAMEELGSIASEIRAAEAELHRIALARGEAERRTQEEERLAERQLREQWEREAAKLESQVPAIEKEIDEAFRNLAGKLRRWVDHGAARERAALQLGQGGMTREVPHVRASGLRTESALAYFLAQAGVRKLIAVNGAIHPPSPLQKG
jgi:hypothetical protein